MVIKKGSLIRLKFLDGKKAFIICGGQSFEKYGYLEKLEKHLAASKIEIVTVKRIIKDPTEDSINTIMTQLKDLNADWIIGVGGGAVMDTAKLIYALYENQNMPLSDFEKPHSVPELRKKAKLCLIPTTAGSGSEVSNSAVVTINNKKTPIISNHFIPDIAILDPNLTISLPSKITAYTSIDAFTHGIESYCSNLNNALTNSYSVAGAKLIIDNLDEVVASPDNVLAREKLLYGSMLTGLAQSMTSVGGVHALSHTVASKIELPHGNLNAIFLIPMLKFNMQESPRIVEFLQQLGFSGIEKLEEWISRIFVNTGMIDKWGSYAKEINIDVISKATLEDICARTNPRKLTAEGVKSILKMTF